MVSAKKKVGHYLSKHKVSVVLIVYHIQVRLDGNGIGMFDTPQWEE
jgi:hypothetical protein